MKLIGIIVGIIVAVILCIVAVQLILAPHPRNTTTPAAALAPTQLQRASVVVGLAGGDPGAALSTRCVRLGDEHFRCQVPHDNGMNFGSAYTDWDVICNPGTQRYNEAACITSEV